MSYFLQKKPYMAAIERRTNHLQNTTSKEKWAPPTKEEDLMKTCPILRLLLPVTSPQGKWKNVKLSRGSGNNNGVVLQKRENRAALDVFCIDWFIVKCICIYICLITNSRQIWGECAGMPTDIMGYRWQRRKLGLGNTGEQETGPYSRCRIGKMQCRPEILWETGSGLARNWEASKEIRGGVW